MAEHLASLGARVAVHGTSPTSTQAFNEAPSLGAVANSIQEATGMEVIPVWGDLSDEETVCSGSDCHLERVCDSNSSLQAGRLVLISALKQFPSPLWRSNL